MSGPGRPEMLELIRRNVEQHGYHVYIVVGGAVPRYGYTIGLLEKLGLELVLPGATYYATDEVKLILEKIHRQLAAGTSRESVFGVDGLGVFSLREAHR